MQKLISTYCFLILSWSLIGQTIEVLKTIAENEGLHDTTRLNAYVGWDDKIYFDDPDLDQEVNEIIIQISEDALEI